MAFDSICHEHLEYYSLNDFVNIAKLTDLKIIHLEFNSSNGGSFRIHLAKNESSFNEFKKLNQILVKKKIRISNF